MSIVKGKFNSDNNSYVIVDSDGKTWTLKGATVEQYRNNSGTIIFTESNIEKLEKGIFQNNTLTDSQIQQYFGGQPLNTLEEYRKEGLELYLQTLDKGQQETLLSEGGSAIKGLLNTEDSSNLKQDKNFGVALPSTDISGQESNDRQRAAGAGKSGVTGKGTFKYPIDMDLNIQDHMVITAAEYVPAGRLPTIFGSNDQGQFVRTYNNKLLETIIIPIPNAIADQNNVSWGPSEMGAVAGTLFDPTSKRILGTAAGEPKEGIMGLLEGTGDYLKELGGAAVNLASSQYIRRRLLLNATAAAASRVGVSVDVGAVISRTAGVIDNPNVELLFNGPGLRTFDFTVRMTPRSKDESKMVRQIIRILKQRMAVKKNVKRFTASGNLLLGTPNVFRLEYRKGSVNRSEIKGLNKFKTCAMTNFRVDYSGGSGRWASYGPDSQPVTTIITMSFSELVPLYENDYSEFPAADDVGF